MNSELSTLHALLLTYAGSLLINTVISGLLYRRNRTALHRNVFLMWGATLVSFTLQGLAGSSHLEMALPFAVIFFTSMALAAVVDELAGVGLPIRGLVLAELLGILGSLTAAQVGLPFFWICAPVVLGASGPMVWSFVRVFYLRKWSSLSSSLQGLVLTSAFFVVHLYNAPFFRDDPSASVVGFIFALLVTFALSAFAPAATVEAATRDKARASTELDLARRLQTSLLPRSPELKGMQLLCHMQSADGMAGDYYDIHTFEHSSWLLIGDVTGHGLSSGLVMLMAQSTLSTVLRANPEICPSELAYLANSTMHRNLSRFEDDRTMTLVAIQRLDCGTYRFCGTSERLYIIRTDGRSEVLDADQMPHPLGLLDEFERDEYAEAGFDLAEGDLLFVSTDGIVEAPRNGDYKAGMFGDDRLLACLIESRAHPLEQIRDELLKRLEAFTSGVYTDDVSFVVVRALGGGHVSTGL